MGSKLHAQESDLKNNFIYGSYGSVVFASQYSLSYERIVYQTGYLNTGVKLSYGHISADGLDFETGERVYENYKGISGVLLFKYFELSLGLAHVNYKLASGFNPDPNVDYDQTLNGFYYYGSTGLRFVTDEFMLKVGIGNLEYLYLGAGFNF